MRISSFIFIIVCTIISCDLPEQKKEIRVYGTAKEENDSLFVPLRLSDFDNYGKLIDRITTIDCNDSIPQIVIEDEHIERHIFPVVECMPSPFCPKSKYIATIRNGKAYHHSSLDPINLDSLQTTIQQDYTYERNGIVKSYLVIIESNSEEKTQGVTDFLVHLTDEFDKIETEKSFNIALWTTVQIPPPPPLNEPEDYQIETTPQQGI